MEQGKTYISILVTSLKTKLAILDELLLQTHAQERLIREEKLDTEEFTRTLEEKDALITRLNQEDDGFQTLYDRVKSDLSGNKDGYKQEVAAMQSLISGITDRSVSLTALEGRNKLGMEKYFALKKKEIKDYQVNSNMASKYYKRMANTHQEQSYYMDQKK